MKKLIIVIVVFQMMSSCTPFSKLKTDKTLNKHSVESMINKPDTLKFELTSGNNIIFKATLDETDTIDLYLDTGGTAIVLKHSAIKERTTLLQGKNKNYKAENYVPLEGTYSLSLGKLKWDSLTIYPTSLLPKEADGHFGWNLFKGKVVELDYEKNLMIIHSTFKGNLEAYAKLEIEYINTLFCIKGDMEVGANKYTNRYLFDSGFQRAVVLDRELVKESKFPQNLPVIKESRLRNSEGTEFINRVVVVDKICFDKICANQVPVQLLSTPNPARFKTHILGNELLKRFNTILDFQNGFVYMKPNALINLPYKDAL